MMVYRLLRHGVTLHHVGHSGCRVPPRNLSWTQVVQMKAENESMAAKDSDIGVGPLSR